MLDNIFLYDLENDNIKLYKYFLINVLQVGSPKDTNLNLGPHILGSLHNSLKTLF